MTMDDVQKYARIALQWLASYLVTRGLIDQNATWVQPAIGLGVGIATFVWTVWGSRLAAKLTAATSVPGVKLEVDPAKAPPAAVAAAADPAQPKITFTKEP